MAQEVLSPEWGRLLRILSDGGWYIRTLFPPSSGKTIPQRVIDDCIDHGLVKTKRVIVRQKSWDSPAIYQTAIHITVRGKRALETGKY